MLITDLLDISSKKIKYGLDRTLKLLDKCNISKNKFLKIQIIGTNGKGSIAAFLTKALYDAGYKVGTYTSPHLLKINERIRVNEHHISNKDIKEFISTHKQSINKIEPSFFEIMTAMAIWYFRKKKVDISILETGLGGRLDSVTACSADVLIFTSISMDHHEILGNTIKKIALEKAQAIQNKEQIIISTTHKEVINNILDLQAKFYNNTILYLNSKNHISLQLQFLFGKHQEENANLAYYALQILHKKKIINISKQQSCSSINKTHWNGRFQIISQKPLIIYDVAHNQASLDSFLQTLINYTQKKGYKNKYLICAFEYNKKIFTGLKNMEKYFDKIICTETKIRKSMDAKDLSKAFKNPLKVIINKDINNAIFKIKTNMTRQDMIAIIGSHFIAPAINRNFKNCFVDNK